MEYFRIGEALSFGWRMYKAHFVFLLVVIAIGFATNLFFSLLQDTFSNSEMHLLSFLTIGCSLVVSTILRMGQMRMYLDLVDFQKEDSYDTIFSQHRLFLRYLLAGIGFAALIVLGMILFIIPGIYLALTYRFFGYLIVDKNMGAMDALKKSAIITKGVKWRLFIFSGILLGINFLGLLFFVVGLFVTIPLSVVADVFVYRALSRRLVESESQNTPVPIPVPAPSSPSTASSTPNFLMESGNASADAASHPDPIEDLSVNQSQETKK
ncbi:MAG: DUF975 family protein [Candidatus Moranbacteria bacterium]|nr:DUF975 family protein [Candidatus Moranbacteria bacterium]